MSDASLYLGAVRVEHDEPAARSPSVALLELPGPRALSSVRAANARSRGEIRIFASGHTKQGRNNHQTTTLDLVRPRVHGVLRADFSPPLTLSGREASLRCASEVEVEGDSAARDPAHRRGQRPRLPCGKWHGSRAPGLPSWRTPGRPAHHQRVLKLWAAIVSEAPTPI